MKYSYVTIAAAGLLAVACASQGASGEQEAAYAPANASEQQSDCFSARAVNGFTGVDRDTVRVRVGVNDYYDVHVAGACMDLEWSHQMAFTTRTRSQLCVGDNFGEGYLVTEYDRCTIDSIAHSPRMPEGEEVEMTEVSPPPE